jgi:hypothetical protein
MLTLILLVLSVRTVLAGLATCTNQIDTLKMDFQNIVMPTFSGINPSSLGNPKYMSDKTEAQKLQDDINKSVNGLMNEIGSLSLLPNATLFGSSNRTNPSQVIQG